jgi:glycosyltransferase involved in cell wall biosynthesis
VNIHIITDTYAPEINGVAMTLERLVKGLTSRGHFMTVIRPRQRHESPKYSVTQRVACKQVRLPGIPVPGYPQLRIGLPAFKSLRRLWSGSRPDIIHIATEGPLGASAIRVAADLKIPVTSSFHTNFHEYAKDYRMRWLKPLVSRWLRHFHNNTTRTFVPTQDLMHRLKDMGYDNLRMLSRGVDSSLFSPERRDHSLRRSWGVGERDLAVIHVGRIAAEKNYPLLFEAFDRIKGTHPSARLVIVGDGPLLSEYQKRRPDAVFSGFYSGETLAAHYASGDVYLHPSLTETFGNVVTEAMASGLPVCAFDDAAAHEFIRSGENGLTASLGDLESFMVNALTLANDRELRQRLGSAARVTAQQLDWGNVVSGFEKDLVEMSEAYHC